MLRLDLQFYAFFVIVLSGAVFGLLFDLLRILRGYLRPGLVVGALADLLFWVVATLGITSGLFYANWADLRFYVLVGTLIGVGLYFWLASAVVTFVIRRVIRVLGWIITSVMAILQKVVWLPAVAIARAVLGLLLATGRWTAGLGLGLLRVIRYLALLILGPLIGPYRCMRLHYLRFLRKWRRRFRR